MTTKKNFLITGGAGFIGSHLVEHYLSKDCHVTVMDNLVTGSLDNLKAFQKNRNFEFIEHDVTQTIDFSGELDYVLHLASLASPVDYMNFPIKTLKVGSLGTHNTLGLAKDKQAVYFLASTSEVYGDPEVHPQKESYWGNVNPIGPRGVYDESKRFSESMTLAYHQAHGLETRIARIFNTYGPRMRAHDGRVVPEFIGQALEGKDLTIFGEGTQTRSFCFVQDLINGIDHLIKSDYNLPVNLGNPTEMTIMQFSELVLKLIGAGSKIVYKPLPVDDPKVRQPDISLAKKLLDWTPEISLEQGLQKTIEYFKNSRS